MNASSDTSGLDYHVLDVFTQQRLAGNPLAVVLDAQGLDDARMQAIAREFNLSETVFVFAPLAGGHARVRIFTPSAELPFAGHPTVGTACLLAELNGLADAGPVELVLEERVGPVPVRVHREPDRAVFAELTTAVLPSFAAAPDRAVLAAVLSLDELDIETQTDAPRGASCGVPFNLVPLRSRGALARARLQAALMPRLGDAPWSSSFYLYCRGDEPDLLHARMFSADLGVGEDPATGSAAAALCGHLAQRSSQSSGMLGWRILQGVEMGRPSQIRIQADKRDGQITAVRVGGHSIRIASGRLNL